MPRLNEQLEAWTQRATEAQQLIATLEAHGFTITQIAARLGVREKAVYRWKSEVVPRPTALVKLRALVKSSMNGRES